MPKSHSRYQFSKHPINHQRKKRKPKQRLILILFLLILIISLKWAWNVFIQVPVNAQRPIDGILVLGGSIQREIYVSEMAKIYPHLPIIISRGSDAPCIFRIFQFHNSPMENVFLENCALSTFDNFVFSVPLLRQKKVHKVRVITSPTHLPRAKYLAQIHLGAQGIAMEIDTANENGVPGNRESRLKTTLDVTRSLMWAFTAQMIQAPCFSVVPLTHLNWPAWEREGYKCERQGRLKIGQLQKSAK